MSEDDYKVGYKCPPKYGQFVPGESGNKGRKKKRPEFQAEIVARVRDERVVVNGVSMTMFELALRSTFNSAIKGRRSHDMKVLFELLDKYGAVPKAEAAEDARVAGEAVIKKIFDHFDRVHDINPEDVAAFDKLKVEEAAIVMNCPSCSPPLRKRWNSPERKALAERYGTSGLQKDVEELKKATQ